ncbi:hypothetical protein QOZ80_5BG0438150 [Eleusine coracana subsp. coracana]|nr:hypothetical protein QOZ80_5BG0438150 [Eleusine coracana subsp. coracana]
MAAGPSPSPSGSRRRRRLSELLDQQQEPFSMDLYLLERGCSPAFLNAAGGSGAACSTCWPWLRTRNAAGRTPLRPAGSTKGSCASGVLRLLLCRILRGKMAQPPRPTNKKRLRLPAVDRRHVEVEKQRTHENSVSVLSPVSVLEQRPLERSPPPAHEQKALLIFRELLQAAYSPTTLLDILAHAKDGRRSKTSTAGRNNNVHWEEDLVEEALAEASEIIATEMAGATAAWSRDVQPERRNVGADIAAALLDALVDETAAELMMMGTDDHDFAVDTVLLMGEVATAAISWHGVVIDKKKLYMDQHDDVTCMLILCV